MKYFRYLLFLLFFFLGFFIKQKPLVLAVGETELPNLCRNGMYDYCSQAPQCGEYADLRWTNGNYPQEWLDKSRELWERYGTLFQHCWGHPYSTCQGYVPLCCYEMVRLRDPHMCNGYDTEYCLPKQCNQVPGSSAKNCGNGAKYYSRERCPSVDINNLEPIPLSQRRQNDVLCNLYQGLTRSQKQTQCSTYPEVCQFCESSSPFTPTPTRPVNQPTATPTFPSGTATSNPTATSAPNCSQKSRGDATCDGLINFADYDLWKCEFLGNGICEDANVDTYKSSDFNNDGVINLIDAEIWRKNKR